MNIEVDSDLLDEARRVCSLRSNTEIVGKALEEFVARRKRAALLKVRRPGLWEGSLAEMRNNRLNTTPIQDLS